MLVGLRTQLTPLINYLKGKAGVLGNFWWLGLK